MRFLFNLFLFPPIIPVFMLCSFQALLQFMYKDSLPEDVEPVTTLTFEFLNLPEIYETLIVKLLAAAEKYGMNRLRLLCEAHICKGVSVKSVAKILALADRYKATELKSACLIFIAENLAGILLILESRVDNLMCSLTVFWFSCSYENQSRVKVIFIRFGFMQFGFDSLLTNRIINAFHFSLHIFCLALVLFFYP